MESGSIDIEQRITDLFNDDQRMLDAIERGIQQACKVNKALGLSMVVWEDGQVKEILAKDLPSSLRE